MMVSVKEREEKMAPPKRNGDTTAKGQSKR